MSRFRGRHAAEPKVPMRLLVNFRLGDEKFGFDIAHVREVIEYGSITPVPLMPEFVCGVINLRGEVVPVIDISSRLGRPRLRIHRRSCIVVVELPVQRDLQVVGLIVDGVSEVAAVPQSAVEPPPSFGLKLRSEFIAGVVKHAGDFVILLDPQSVLSMEEFEQLAVQLSDSSAMTARS